MVVSPGSTIAEHFATRTDPRIDHTKRHHLLDLLTIALCAIISGAGEWVAMEAYGKAKREWFDTFLDLPNGIRSHDTFGRVFAALDPDQSQRCFLDWVRATVTMTDGAVVACDGKTVRRSHDRGAGKSAVHIVSAWASASRLVLGQIAVDEKSNEMTALPALLNLLMLNGCIVTIDAMGCQTAIAQTMIERGADYVLALKGIRRRSIMKSFTCSPIHTRPTSRITAMMRLHERTKIPVASLFRLWHTYDISFTYRPAQKVWRDQVIAVGVRIESGTWRSKEAATSLGPWANTLKTYYAARDLPNPLIPSKAKVRDWHMQMQKRKRSANGTQSRDE